MGEIADDMIEGACCSWCGEYFEDEHGYPVVCKRCYAANPSKAISADLQKATMDTL